MKEVQINLEKYFKFFFRMGLDNEAHTPNLWQDIEYLLGKLSVLPCSMDIAFANCKFSFKHSPPPPER